MISGTYLVFAERHHASEGCIRSGKDVWRVFSPLRTVVQLGELREATCLDLVKGFCTVAIEGDGTVSVAIKHWNKLKFVTL